MAAQAEFEDSNIALIGTKADHELRAFAASKELAWQDAGKQVGIEVWRINQFKVEAWPKNMYGAFYSGDAYIVLNTYKADPKSEKLSYNVHFWLGSGSTQDEQGTAAYKTVELDDYLGSLPVEYREVQYNESTNFLALFPRIRYLDGGVDSGFTHVEPEKYVARLFRLSSSSTFLTQLPTCKLEFLSNNDVFVLDNGLEIYQWNGSKSNAVQKNDANLFVLSIVDERHGKPKKTVLDGLEANTAFWKLLGVKDGNTPPPNSISDKVYEDPDSDNNKRIKKNNGKTSFFDTQLWKLSDETGKLKLTLIAKGLNVNKSLLTPDDVFLVDIGAQLFVYVGSKASPQEKKSAIAYASSYLAKANGNTGRENTPISRIIEGTTSAEFELAFRRSLLSTLPPPHLRSYVQREKDDILKDVHVLHKALKEDWFTDCSTLSSLLCERTMLEIKDIRALYQQEYNQDLLKVIVSETRGLFEDLMKALIMNNAEYDAYRIHRSIADSIILDENALILILAHRPLNEIKAIDDEYMSLYGKHVYTSIHARISGEFGELLSRRANVSLRKQENPTVNAKNQPEEIQLLYQASQGKLLGHDIAPFIEIFSVHSNEYLFDLSKEYEKAHKKTLQQIIKGWTFQSHSSRMLLAMITPLDEYFSGLIHSAMTGLGFHDDNMLVRVIGTQRERNLISISKFFENEYKISLKQFIINQTKGHFQKALTRLFNFYVENTVA